MSLPGGHPPSPRPSPCLAEARACARPTAGAVGQLPVLIWGPLSIQDCQHAHAPLVPTSSIAIQPHVEESVRRAAVAEVPHDVYQRDTDTAKTLAARLDASTFLEDMHVLKGGKGPGRIRLNSTQYAQPRRRSWALLVEREHLDGDGDRVYTALNYTAYGRLPADWSCRAMPRPIFDLAVALWHVAYPFLPPISAALPPKGRRCALRV